MSGARSRKYTNHTAIHHILVLLLVAILALPSRCLHMSCLHLLYSPLGEHTWNDTSTKTTLKTPRFCQCLSDFIHTYIHVRYEIQKSHAPINSRLQFSLAIQFKILLKPSGKSPLSDRETFLVQYICISGLPWHLHVHKHMLLQNQLHQVLQHSSWKRQKRIS